MKNINAKIERNQFAFGRMGNSLMYTKKKIIDVVCGVLEEEGKYFLARRKPGKSLEGMWEFPGGKIEFGESAQKALQRELKEEFGIEVEVGSKVGQKRHDYEDFSIHLHGYFVTSESKEFQLVDHDESGWFTVSEIYDLPLAEADKFLIELVTPIEIEALDPDDSAVHEMIRELDDYLEDIYPPYECQMDAATVFKEEGNYLFGIRNEDELVAMGGVKFFDDYVEIKRMYVRPNHRGRGYAYRILAHLEDFVFHKGGKRLLLETGPKQFEAVSLYERGGYAECDKFGDYEETPNTMFMEKLLLKD